MVATNAAPGIYDAALQRRQKLMGASGPRALVKNRRVFMIALFATIGGLLYGNESSLRSKYPSEPLQDIIKESFRES